MEFAKRQADSGSVPALNSEIWGQISRWWRAYDAAWQCLDDIKPIIDERWESSQFWIDQCRGAFFCLSLPFFIDRTGQKEQWADLQKAFNEHKALEKELLDKQADWVSVLVKAMDAKLAGVAPPKVSASTFAGAQLDAFKIEWKLRFESWAKGLEKHPYGFRVSYLVRNSEWLAEFDQRVAKIEEFAAVLAAASAGKRQPAPLRKELPPQVDEMSYGVLKRLADSKVRMTIESIAGSKGCPKQEKTVRRIVKNLLADGLVERPGRYGIAITMAGRNIL